jgi:hypothetical protein
MGGGGKVTPEPAFVVVQCVWAKPRLVLYYRTYFPLDAPVPKGLSHLNCGLVQDGRKDVQIETRTKSGTDQGCPCRYTKGIKRIYTKFLANVCKNIFYKNICICTYYLQLLYESFYLKNFIY